VPLELNRNMIKLRIKMKFSTKKRSNFSECSTNRNKKNRWSKKTVSRRKLNYY